MSPAFLGFSQFLLRDSPFSTESLTYETFRLLFLENFAVNQITRRTGHEVVDNPIFDLRGLRAEQIQFPLPRTADSLGVRIIVGQMSL